MFDWTSLLLLSLFLGATVLNGSLGAFFHGAEKGGMNGVISFLKRMFVMLTAASVSASTFYLYLFLSRLTGTFDMEFATHWSRAAFGSAGIVLVGIAVSAYLTFDISFKGQAEEAGAD